MKWINVNEQYLDYLRTIESRIPYTNYGDNKFKPFFGILFETNDLLYITQVSHAKERHKKMTKKKDFYKIYDSNNSNRLIAVINLNYMFPIPKTEITPFKKKDIESYRNFKSQEQRSKYIRLLNMEMKVINTMNLSLAAKEIYELKNTYPEHIISKRCLNFKQLEVYAKKWNK